MVRTIDAGAIPLPCHGDTRPAAGYLCAWCARGITRRSATVDDLARIASLYPDDAITEWAIPNGVHPGTSELAALLPATLAGRRR